MKSLIGDIFVEYQVMGEGQPILILGKHMMKSLEPIFDMKPGWKRIYINYPGIGNTKVTDDIKTSDDILSVIIEFIDKIIGTEKFLLAGFSYSSYLARGVIYKRPELIKGLLMICPVIVADSSQRNIENNTMVFRDHKFISTLAESELEDLQPFVIHDKNIWDKAQDLNKETENLADMIFFNRLKQNGWYSFSFEVDYLKSPFNEPTLILLGRQDSIVGYKDVFKIADNFPRASIVILDMAGHNLNIEQEKLFNTLVLEWLGRIDQLIS